jgi:hypothetical protein
MRRLSLAAALGVLISLAGTVLALQILTDFEGFTIGASIDGQHGWSASNPAWDQKVVRDGGNTVWRVSNAVTSGNFADMPFSPRLGGIPVDPATNPTNSNPGAFAGETSTDARLDRFRAQFSFRSATGGAQPGARITVSADNGTGGRQSFIALEDKGAGINVVTFDIDRNGYFIGAKGCILGGAVPCPPIAIASGLSYKKWHTTSVDIHFKDGEHNDRVKYFVDGKRVHTGPSWEQYYRNVQASTYPKGVPVQTLLFRLAPTDGFPSCVACLGGGYFIDNVGQSVSRSDDEDDQDRDSRDDD